MREIVLDTETTGLDPKDGHRVIEIGAVELFNHLPTGREYHTLLNPERAQDAAAIAVHGISDAQLAGAPLFTEIVEDFLAFIGNDRLIIHNAAFDLGFLNAELSRAGFPPLPRTRAVDTVVLARQKFPGAPAGLDALCKRFSIDLSVREKHGALVDSRLLAEVYLELLGGRQSALGLEVEASAHTVSENTGSRRRAPRPHCATAEEKAAHAAFIATLQNPLWEKLT